MRRVCSLGVVLAIGCTAFVGCSEPPPPRPSLRCEGLPWPNVVSLCHKVEQELVYTRGGHALIFGSPDYFCTPQTIERVICSGASVDIAQVQEALAFASSPRQDEVFFETRLYACLLGILHAADPTTLEPEQRYDAKVTCPPKP